VSAGRNPARPADRLQLTTISPAVGRRAWLVFVVFVATLVVASAAHAQSTLRVHFLQGEQTVAVQRPGATAADAIAALLAGPSATEQRSRIVSELPEGLPLLGLEAADGVATVDFGSAFAGDGDAAVSARVAQVVLTLTGLPGIHEVRVLVEGTELGVRTRADVVAPPSAEAPAAAPVLPRMRGSMTVVQVQRRLIKLGYLAQGAATDHFDQPTRSAVIAFQKWEGLIRDGIPGPVTQAALLVAKRPKPRTVGTGTRVEVLLDRQVVLVIRGGRVLRTVHVSTGKRGYATPVGRYRVTRKSRRSWSVPYRVWMPWATYFVRGIAFHQAQSVPVTPASHGCVRVTAADARWLYALTPVGTKVRVIARSLPPSPED
jgi:L,D-transpeptidase-like protein/sporulation and spore germination protein/putative peptidoglycan binding protein